MMGKMGGLEVGNKARPCYLCGKPCYNKGCRACFIAGKSRGLAKWNGRHKKKEGA
jgi:hypothetical protein